MKNKNIITKIKKEYPTGRIRGVVGRDSKGYATHVMLSYSEGKGLGCMGSRGIYEIRFKTRYNAEKLKDLINKTFKNRR